MLFETLMQFWSTSPTSSRPQSRNPVSWSSAPVPPPTLNDLTMSMDPVPLILVIPLRTISPELGLCRSNDDD